MNKLMFILFIDDDNSILASIKRSLHKWFIENDISPLFSNSGKDAIELLKKHNKDIGVIISDQKMPDLNGNELINLIKSRYPDIVPIILSGNSDFQDMENYIKSNVFSFIQKPWNNTQLQNEIKKAIDHYNLKVENRALKEQIEKELLLAGDFQKKIMSNGLNKNLPIPINVTYNPCKSTGVSGDYYEIIKISETKIVVLLGDVAGHGIKPGFISMALKSIIYFEYFNIDDNIEDFSPSKFSNWLNVRICNYLKGFPDIFITFTALFINLQEQECIICNSGQPAPIILAHSNIYSLDNNNMVLGVNKENEYTDEKISLTKDSKIFLCSDGIYPTGSSSKNYNLEDLYTLLQEYNFNKETHEQLLNRITDKFLTDDIDDDVTIITLDFSTT